MYTSRMETKRTKRNEAKRMGQTKRSETNGTTKRNEWDKRYETKRLGQTTQKKRRIERIDNSLNSKMVLEIKKIRKESAVTKAHLDKTVSIKH